MWCHGRVARIFFVIGNKIKRILKLLTVHPPIMMSATTFPSDRISSSKATSIGNDTLVMTFPCWMSMSCWLKWACGLHTLQ